MKEEVWRDIPGYEGIYLVNQYGDVFSLYSNKKLRYSLSPDGYKQYNLSKDKKKHLMFAHKAVALAFIPNPNEYPCVNHKDENKLNCYVENLEWCTIGYNNCYNGKAEKIAEKTRKKVFCYSVDGNLYKVYKSTREAGKDLNASSGNISSAAQWKQSTKNRKKFLTVKGKVLSYKERSKEEILEHILQL